MRNMDKEHNIFKLLKNEHFVKWVQNPTDDSNHFWSKWISNHKDQKKDVEIARRIIQSGRLKSNKQLAENQYDSMLDNIMAYADERKQTTGPYLTRTFWRYTAVAASLILMLLSLGLLMDFTSGTDDKMLSEFITKEAPFGSKVTTRLPDGSMVTLNSGSSITYPEHFNEDSRPVELSGEGFFEVEHNPSMPFIISFRDQTVTVLGTSFNIRAFDQESYAEVAVATGKVAYAVKSGSKVVLTANNKATLKKGSSQFEQTRVNELADFGWLNRVLYFESNSFEEIRLELEKWYGIEVQIDGNTPSGTYSGKFENASLDEVLTGLSFIYRFDFTIDDTNVLITIKPKQ